MSRVSAGAVVGHPCCSFLMLPQHRELHDTRCVSYIMQLSVVGHYEMRIPESCGCDASGVKLLANNRSHRFSLPLRLMLDGLSMLVTGKPGKSGAGDEQTNKQKFKVRQPQRAAKSKRPNAPSDGSKNNGIHTTKQEEYPSRHPTTDTANSSTSKQITSRRLIGVSKSNTIQSTNQAGCPVSPPHMYHPRRPAHQPRLIPKHVAI